MTSKCEVNKIRAQVFAAETQQALTWSIAKDKPGNKVLAEKLNLEQEKEAWLTRHDRDCADLYGTLPLADGLPVMLTEHYDRNPEKALLKGRIGYMKSWILDDREDSEYQNNVRYLRYPPKTVLVQFTEWVLDEDEDRKVERPCSWVLDGMSEAGVYPIRPWNRDWFLDQRRQRPQLGVKRRQLPLAPAYAITAHGSQGQTLLAAFLDLQIGRGVSAIASYVAMTRIKTRHDLLIFRNFDRAVFMQGEPEGPSLLLRKLRGEKIDWKAVEEKHAPKRRCKGPCLSVKMKEDFSQKEWENKEDPHCKVCLQRLKEQGKTVRCVKCRAWCGEEERTEGMVRHCHLSRLVCGACSGRSGPRNFRKCGQCGKEKPETDFPASRWRKELQKRSCNECANARECSSCGRRDDRTKYHAEEWEKPDGQRRCKDCVPKRCSCCKKAKRREFYSRAQWVLAEGQAQCSDYDRKRCAACNVLKGSKHFILAMWEKDDGSPELHCLEPRGSINLILKVDGASTLK